MSTYEKTGRGGLPFDVVEVDPRHIDASREAA